MSFGHADPQRCVTALAPYEPHTPWREQFLSRRARCYERAGHALAPLAATELTQFREDAGVSLTDGLQL